MRGSCVTSWWLATSLINLSAAGTIASPSAYLTLHCDNRGALYTSNDNGATWELSGTAEHWPTPFVAEILDIVPETVIRWECMLNFAVSFCRCQSLFVLSAGNILLIQSMLLILWSSQSSNHLIESLFLQRHWRRRYWCIHRHGGMYEHFVSDAIYDDCSFYRLTPTDNSQLYSTTNPLEESHWTLISSDDGITSPLVYYPKTFHIWGQITTPGFVLRATFYALKSIEIKPGKSTRISFAKWLISTILIHQNLTENKKFSHFGCFLWSASPQKLSGYGTGAQWTRWHSNSASTTFLVFT